LNDDDTFEPGAARAAPGTVLCVIVRFGHKLSGEMICGVTADFGIQTGAHCTPRYILTSKVVHTRFLVVCLPAQLDRIGKPLRAAALALAAGQQLTVYLQPVESEF
jgi:hypothetical protein